jgi:hypothetical protein
MFTNLATATEPYRVTVLSNTVTPLVRGTSGAVVSIAGVLSAAEMAVRELCVYLSYDRDAAAQRGDREAAEVLRERWSAAGQLADELHALDPAAVLADPSALAEARALVGQLSWRLAALVPARRAATATRSSAATLDDVHATRGQPPYGYRATNGELIPEFEEQRQVQRMTELRAAGASLRAIAAQLNAEGVPARRGHWHAQTVARVIERAAARKAS